MVAIVYFRRDLRLQNNAALSAAVSKHSKLALTYIHNHDDTKWQMGDASKWYLHNSLRALASSLEALHHKLLINLGNELEFLLDLAKRTGAEEIFWNRNYEPQWVARDNLLKTALQKYGLTVNICHDYSLLKPGTVLNKTSQPYKVFTPYWRTLFSELLSRDSLDGFCVDLSTVESADGLSESSVDDLGLLDTHNWHFKLQAAQTAGEIQALQKLEVMHDKLTAYPVDRDFPSQNATTSLSAALHFGEISPWRIFNQFRPLLLGEQGAELAVGALALVRQLGWREFAINLLFQHPDSSENSLQAFYDQSPIWGNDHNLIQLWQQGNTGCDLVDAGMRELWETGDMHNRVRLVVASYLTKNLGQHWLHGARWFWNTLVDADLANNTMGWQWVAGCGCDAAPFYRIFNPERQAQRFDPNRDYISRWLGDRRAIEPLVDLRESRQAALVRYAISRNN